MDEKGNVGICTEGSNSDQMETRMVAMEVEDENQRCAEMEKTNKKEKEANKERNDT